MCQKNWTHYVRAGQDGVGCSRRISKPHIEHSQEKSPAKVSHRPRSHVTKKLLMSAMNRLLLLFSAQGSPLEGALGPRSWPVTISLFNFGSCDCDYPKPSIHTLPSAESAQAVPISNLKKNHLFIIITHLSSYRIMTSSDVSNNLPNYGSEKWKSNIVNYKGCWSQDR